MFVISKYSRRARGHVVACDLLRAVLHSTCDLAAERHSGAMFARLAEDFGGYLVTDGDPVAVADVEAGYPFRNSREKYEWGVMPWFCTSPEIGGRGVGLHCVDVGSYPIDAPERMAAGAMMTNGFDDWPVTFGRGGL